MICSFVKMHVSSSASDSCSSSSSLLELSNKSLDILVDYPYFIFIQAPSPEFIRHLITTFILDVKTGNANLFQFTQQPQNNNYSKNYSQWARNYFLLRLQKHNRHIGYDDKGAPHAESISLDTPRYVTISG
jgi:hypothetical protein